MQEVELPDLAFARMPIGTHGAEWGLRAFMYRGGAAIDRRKFEERVESLGAPILSRLPLILSLHELIEERLEGGAAYASIASRITDLTAFVTWVDSNVHDLTSESARELFRLWVESLIHRYQVKKEISQQTAYSQATRVASLLGCVLRCGGTNPGRSLMKHTRLRRPKGRKATKTAKADKQRLDDTFAFGNFLADLCGGLTEERLRSELPLRVPLRNGQTVLLMGKMKVVDESLIVRKGDQNRSRQRKARIPADVSVVDERPSLLNIRIEAELLIFLAQTGMNLSQAAKLRREQYRWQTDGDELNAFRVFKGRRGGEAVFRCFKAYREHLHRYLHWVDAVALSEDDDRLFPFVYHMGKTPAEHKVTQFQAVRKLCGASRIPYLGPRILRKTRVNWLIRRSRDAELTAQQSAHAKETLLKVYEEPHHQAALAEIVRFHEATDPTLMPPGPGMCASNAAVPVAMESKPSEAPVPDCVSPDGCLFCRFHRDVMSADYCWKLASHRHLKKLEAALHKPAESDTTHPANAVIDRIGSKLHVIAEGSGVRGDWVRNAIDAVRSGAYHPYWDTQIQLFEAMNDSG